MTVSIKDVLSLLPSGASAGALTLEEVGTYLTSHYDTQDEKDRNARHLLRDQLYRDGGDHYMRSLIDKIFRDTDVRQKRKDFVELARFNNGLKRIVNEMSTVYAEPAKREVTSGNDQYQKLLEAVHMDETLLQASRLLNLHRALLVGFRVRQKLDGTREPVVDIATPANVRAVMHPLDSTLVIAWMIRTEYRTAKPSIDAPGWTLWTDAESVQLRSNLSVISSSYQEHQLGVIPWVPILLGPISPGFWPGNEGEDLVAAHLALWLSNILLLKEEKSATKQTVYQGDGTNVARGQAADSEVPIEVADGQSATTVDMSMDLSLFRDTSDHVLNNAGMNYGLSPALMQHQGVQSAQARELMRMPLREIRKQQQIPFRRFELQLATVMSAVVKIDLSEFSFDPAGFAVQFSEAETPLDPLSEQTLFEKRRAAGLDNSLAMLARLFPGISLEKALKKLTDNIDIETNRVVLMRPLAAMQGGLAAELPDTQVKVAEAVEVGAPGAPPRPGSAPAAKPPVPTAPQQPPPRAS